MPKAVTTSFLALTPKFNNPQVLDEYIPISLISNLYRTLAKLSSSKMKKVMSELTSVSHVAFLSQRQMPDGVLVLKYVMEFAKRKNKDCILIKVDFCKVYDCVSW